MEMKTAQFPATGRKTAQYHTNIGQPIVGTAGKVNEVLVSVDSFLYSDQFIADIDEAIAHFEVRQEFSRQMGEALAKTFDQTVAQVGILAARMTTPRVSGEADMVGGYTNDTDFATSATALKDGIFAAAQSMDEKDVPEDNRNCFLRPAAYHRLAKDKDVITRDIGGAGDIRTGKIAMLGGISLVKTNNLPNSDVTGTYNDKYNVDAANTVALIMTPEAVATAKLRDISMLMTGDEYKATHFGTLVVGRYLMGHGILRAECAHELRTANPS